MKVLTLKQRVPSRSVVDCVLHITYITKLAQCPESAPYFSRNIAVHQPAHFIYNMAQNFNKTKVILFNDTKIEAQIWPKTQLI